MVGQCWHNCRSSVLSELIVRMTIRPTYVAMVSSTMRHSTPISAGGIFSLDMLEYIYYGAS